MENFDLIAIGDIITDDFIRLEDPRIRVTEIDRIKELTIPYGEKMPFAESYVVSGVGNAPNASVSAARLGLKSAIVGSVGDDRAGEDTIESFKNNNVSIDFISKQKDKKSNYSYVLWYKDDRTILRKHEDFTYDLPNIGEPKWIYFSSISYNAYPYHDKIADYLEAHPNVKFAFQPGSNEIKLGSEKLKRLYAESDISFCNVEEAEEILGINTLGIKELLKRFKELGPKIVIITDGPNGAHAYDGNEMYQVPVYPDPKPPLERTGAGDAFSSTIAIALSLGKTLEEALLWGAINSMSVVQEIGAQKGLLSREKLEEYLKSAPETFKISKI